MSETWHYYLDNESNIVYRSKDLWPNPAGADCQEVSVLPLAEAERLRQAEARIHALYECRLEPDKLLCMIEHYEQDRKRAALLGKEES